MRTGDAGKLEASRDKSIVRAWDEMMRPVYAVCPAMRPCAELTAVVDFPAWWWRAVERVMGIKPLEQWRELPRPQRIRQYGRLLGQVKALIKSYRANQAWREDDPATVAVVTQMRQAIDPWHRRAEELIDRELHWAQTLELRKA